LGYKIRSHTDPAGLEAVIPVYPESEKYDNMYVASDTRAETVNMPKLCFIIPVWNQSFDSILKYRPIQKTIDLHYYFSYVTVTPSPLHMSGSVFACSMLQVFSIPAITYYL
jgi:hypothetical protein